MDRRQVRSLNVAPHDSADDLSDVTASQSEFVGQFSLGDTASVVSDPDRTDQISGYLRARMPVAPYHQLGMLTEGVILPAPQPFGVLARSAAIPGGVTSFGDHVVKVGLLRSNPKVTTSGVEEASNLIGSLVVVPDAVANIADMADQKPLGDRPGDLLPSCLMGTISGPIELEDAVAPVANFSGPDPARSVLGAVSGNRSVAVNVERETLRHRCWQASAVSGVQATASAAAIETESEPNLLGVSEEDSAAQSAHARRGTLRGHRDYSSVSAPALAGVRGLIVQGLYHNA